MKNALQLNTAEQKMLNEVFNIFSKYKTKTREFGIQLVHSHFPMDQGEVLYETHDANARVLKVVPKKNSEFPITPKATAWKRSETGKIEVVMFCCDDDGGSGNDIPIHP